MTGAREEGHLERAQRLFGTVLGREPEPDEDFFELGGDSFRAVMIAVDLGAELDLDLDPDIVFEHRTARALGAHLAAQGEPGRNA